MTMLKQYFFWGLSLRFKLGKNVRKKGRPFIIRDLRQRFTFFFTFSSPCLHSKLCICALHLFSFFVPIKSFFFSQLARIPKSIYDDEKWQENAEYFEVFFRVHCENERSRVFRGLLHIISSRGK